MLVLVVTSYILAGPAQRLRRGVDDVAEADEVAGAGGQVAVAVALAE